MDEITKKIVRRTILANPDLSVKYVIRSIRLKQGIGSGSIKLTQYSREKNNDR